MRIFQIDVDVNLMFLGFYILRLGLLQCHCRVESVNILVFIVDLNNYRVDKVNNGISKGVSSSNGIPEL